MKKYKGFLLLERERFYEASNPSSEDHWYKVIEIIDIRGMLAKDFGRTADTYEIAEKLIDQKLIDEVAEADKKLTEVCL